MTALKQVDCSGPLLRPVNPTSAMRASLSLAGCISCGAMAAEESMPPVSLVPEHWSNILLVFFALMCAAAVWFAWRQRKIAGAGLDYRLQMVGGISFGTKERLVMVKIKDRILLLGVTAHQINLIKEFPEDDFLTTASLPSAAADNMAAANTNNLMDNG